MTARRTTEGALMFAAAAPKGWATTLIAEYRRRNFEFSRAIAPDVVSIWNTEVVIGFGDGVRAMNCEATMAVTIDFIPDG
jgi:hypothetical protein